MLFDVDELTLIWVMKKIFAILYEDLLGYHPKTYMSHEPKEEVHVLLYTMGYTHS